ncbi:Transmembrane amino acid transporter [Pseudozyma hubeiensis]|nr:Transmembrane amino acid transporter [Pseudozyma hubeiensis]
MPTSPSPSRGGETSYPTVSTQPSHLSIHHPSEPTDDGPQPSSLATHPTKDAGAQNRSDRGVSSSRSGSLRPRSRRVDTDELEEADSDAASEFDAFMRKGRIDVGQAWDDSSDEEDQEQAVIHEDRTLPLAATGNSAAGRRRRKAKRGQPESVLQSLRPSREHRREWWKFLTNPSTPASLSAPHVSANLFSASLHPAVLLSMPHYFARTGIVVGTIALVGVAVLGGVGGGLWVVLSRYVNGSSIEAIVGASFGRYTPWKGGLGRVVSGLLLALYATGSAIIGYFALADLLLQVFFNYAPRGVPLHDRAFVTLVVGGLISVPLVIFPLAKRNLIRLNTFFSLSFYPVIVTIVMVKIFATSPPLAIATPSPQLEGLQSSHSGTSNPTKGGRWPNANPLHPPSIWAPISLLPLLTLSACPLQILAHQRSLRRVGTSRSNVKAFLGAQAGQVLFVIAMAILFGIVAGVKGVQGRLRKDVHPNLFASLPSDDDWTNVARVLFLAILATHLAICLTTARSSWGRLLRLLNLNPLRRRRQPIQLPDDDADESVSAVGPQAAGTNTTQDASQFGKWKRKWGKPARNALAGVLLWGITASSAYLSGAGGFRRSEKEGEEARFTRAAEVLGLMGAAVGFVMPGLVWMILFHIRRPRAILPPFASEIGKTASAYFSGPLSMLARNRKYLFGSRDAAGGEAERQPLLDDQGDEEAAEHSEASQAKPNDQQSASAGIATSSRHSGSINLDRESASIPSHLTEQSSDDRDEATTILLARKERQLQRRTRGKRIYQDVVVFAAVLPFGFALLILGAIELHRGGY